MGGSPCDTGRACLGLHPFITPSRKPAEPAGDRQRAGPGDVDECGAPINTDASGDGDHCRDADHRRPADRTSHSESDDDAHAHRA